MSGQRPELDELVEMVRSHDELADVDRPVRAGDVRDHHMQTTPVRQQRVDERAGQVQPAPGRLEHAFDQVPHCLRGQDRRRQLGTTSSSHEHPPRLVDPDLLDGRVVEVALQQSVASHGVVHVLGRTGDVLEHRHRAGEASLVVRANDLLDQAAHRAGVSSRVDAAPSDGVSDLRVDDFERDQTEHLPTQTIPEAPVAASKHPRLAALIRQCPPDLPLSARPGQGLWTTRILSERTTCTSVPICHIRRRRGQVADQLGSRWDRGRSGGDDLRD